MEITIEKNVIPIVKLGLIQFDNIHIFENIEQLNQIIDTASNEIRKKYKSTQDAMQRLSITRGLYRKIGIDPTKNRPSSEALLRRVLKNLPLYQINSIVDICNLSSLSFLLSIGLYDRDKISGNVVLREGREHECYLGIRKDRINVAGKFTLTDVNGPFGNPSADSDRTKITLETQNVLFAIFAPREYDNNELMAHINFIKEHVLLFHSCDSYDTNII